MHLMPSATWLQSYSGVRAKVGPGPNVTPDDEVFAFRHAYCYCMSRLQANPASRARFVVARDRRPTGAVLIGAQARGLATACHDVGVELELIDLLVVPTPVWQHSVRLFEAHGGVMITASHNPVDENGWKYATGVATFGVDPAPPGALLSAAEMGNLIRAANAFAPHPWPPVHPAKDTRRRPGKAPSTSQPDEAARERAIANYVRFLSDTYFAHAQGARVVVDPNGGAACAVAGRAFRALGVEPILINDVEGQVAHEIDVEHARADGTHVLDGVAERVRAEGALFGLAYDFDADRGNLTYVDAAGATWIPSPQAAAAMNTAIALAVHRRSGDSRRPAVVASDATSCRVKQVAAAFGAEFVEVETGEINVVTKMQDLEMRDLCAVVGVEGPNGGTVFSGTTCRDGTLVGAGALLAAADPELRAIVARTLAPGREMGRDLAGFIELLPPQRSFAEKHSAPLDWKRTVDAFDRDFPRTFETELARTWERFDIVYSYTRHVGRERPSASGYGWKARLFRPGAEGFLWIRGSKTEAGVARIVGDAPDEAAARALVDIGRRLLSAAIG
jgi:phosphomannomutase